jgi:hypothetical protein
MSYSCKEDFIKRTKKIVEEYQQDKEITLLINCMLGLLVFIKEQYPPKIPSDKYTDWGLTKDSIKTCLKKKGVKSDKIKDVIRHLRNAVSHGYFDVITERKNEITHIEFTDYPYGNKKMSENFLAKISMTDLKPFLLKFAQSILGDLKRNPNP